MNSLKHFQWAADGFGGGRVAVRVENEVIQIAQIAGNAPPANPFFLAALVSEYDYGNHFEAAHLRRRNPWAIEARVGMSGAADIRLRVLENEALGDAPVKNVMHVSMHDKLNRGYSGWIGDFYAILENWPFPAREGEMHLDASGNFVGFSVTEVPVFQPANGWNYPAIEGVRDEFNSATLAALAAGIDIRVKITDEYPADEIEIAA